MDDSKNTSTSPPDQFLISPPSLQRLCSQEMSLILYRYLAHNSGIDTLCGDWFRKNVFDPKDIIDNLPTPVSKMIQDSIRYPVNVSIIEWCNYHGYHSIFDCSLHFGILKSIDEFVLKCDGTINFRKTAQNILRNGSLNSMEKFKLASLYSLVGDIENIWPTVHDNPKLSEYTRGPWESFMICYWIRVMKGDSPRFPNSASGSFEEFSEILTGMNWSSVEYFWNKFDSDEQLEAARRLLIYRYANNVYPISNFEPLFLRLGNTQLLKVLEMIHFPDMFPAYSQTRAMCPKMFETWNYVKYFISQSDFHFIIEELIYGGFCLSLGNEFCTLLFEMWKTAPNQLRLSFLNKLERVELTFKKLHSTDYLEGRLPNYYLDMRFYIAVLNELNLESRNSIWRKFWRNIIMCTSPDSLYHIMKLCFNDDNEITQFKERYMLNFDEIKVFCDASFSSGCISILNNYLSFCSSNIHYVMTVKQQIISSKSVLYYFTKKTPSYENFIEFDKFIDSAFYDETHVRKFKENLLESHVVLRKVWETVNKTLLGIRWL